MRSTGIQRGWPCTRGPKSSTVSFKGRNRESAHTSDNTSVMRWKRQHAPVTPAFKGPRRLVDTLLLITCCGMHHKTTAIEGKLPTCNVSGTMTESWSCADSPKAKTSLMLPHPGTWPRHKYSRCTITDCQTAINMATVGQTSALLAERLKQRRHIRKKSATRIGGSKHGGHMRTTPPVSTKHSRRAENWPEGLQHSMNTRPGGQK